MCWVLFVFSYLGSVLFLVDGSVQIPANPCELLHSTTAPPHHPNEVYTTHGSRVQSGDPVRTAPHAVVHTLLLRGRSSAST